jgi:hypothetical protein
MTLCISYIVIEKMFLSLKPTDNISEDDLLISSNIGPAFNKEPSAILNFALNSS